MRVKFLNAETITNDEEWYLPVEQLPEQHIIHAVLAAGTYKSLKRSEDNKKIFFHITGVHHTAKFTMLRMKGLDFALVLPHETGVYRK